jgi:chaperone BCS1
MTGRDQRNNVLQKAITLYIDQHCSTQMASSKNAKVDLMAIKFGDDSRSYSNDSDEDEDDADAQANRKTGLGELKKYKITSSVLPNLDFQIDKGLILKIHTSDDQDNKDGKGGTGGSSSMGSKKVVTFSVRCKGPDAVKRVNGFIEQCYGWYKNELSKKVDKSRYMYVLMTKTLTTRSNDDGDSESSNDKTYKRYRLSDEKTFHSLFFAQKETLLHILHNFAKKSGRYAIAGYPHKLGLLLHGPPGTGKTSLIKALAHHTQRSIVNVPLSRISTNQELMDVVFDQRYSVKGEDVPIRLKFKDVVYVFEDVDAASKVVHRREGGAANRKETTTVTVTHSGADAEKRASGEEAESEAERNAIELALKASANENEAKGEKSSGPLKLADMLLLDFPDKLDLSGESAAARNAHTHARTPSATAPLARCAARRHAQRPYQRGREQSLRAPCSRPPAAAAFPPVPALIRLPLACSSRLRPLSPPLARPQAYSTCSMAWWTRPTGCWS